MSQLKYTINTARCFRYLEIWSLGVFLRQRRTGQIGRYISCKRLLMTYATVQNVKSAAIPSTPSVRPRDYVSVNVTVQGLK